MTKIAERQDKLGNLIKSEYGTEYGHCRDSGVISAALATALDGDLDGPVGTVVAVVASEYVAYNEAGVDGSEVIVGVLIEDKALTAGDAVVILSNGPALVADAALKYTGTAATVHAALEAKGIKVAEQI